MSWKIEITMAVKDVAIENVVDTGHILRPAQDGKREALLPRQRLDFFRIGRSVQVDRKQLKTLSRQARGVLVENHPIFFTSLCSGGHKLSSTGFP